MTTEGGWEQMPPTFLYDGSWDFFKIDKKITGGGIVANLKRSRGRGQKTPLPYFITLVKPLDGRHLGGGPRFYLLGGNGIKYKDHYQEGVWPYMGFCLELWEITTFSMGDENFINQG